MQSAPAGSGRPASLQAPSSAVRAAASSAFIIARFDPDDLRAAVDNWEDIAGHLLRHLHSDVAASNGLLPLAGLNLLYMHQK